MLLELALIGHVMSADLSARRRHHRGWRYYRAERRIPQVDPLPPPVQVCSTRYIKRGGAYVEVDSSRRQIWQMWRDRIGC